MKKVLLHEKGVRVVWGGGAFVLWLWDFFKQWFGDLMYDFSFFSLLTTSLVDL